MNEKFAERIKAHDKFENEIMDVMRPFTTRKHLPDRFVSFSNKLYAWDAKTNIFVEKNSHDEYFRVQEENNIPVFIVYQDKGIIMAGWITEINWEGPFPPSPNSTFGDPYYRISGGRTLDEFLEGARQKEYGNENCRNDKNFYGVHVLVFEKTSPDDGTITLDGKTISREQLISFLKFDDD